MYVFSIYPVYVLAEIAKPLPTNTGFHVLEKENFEHIGGIKGENAGNQHFLLFPQFVLPFRELNLNLPIPNLSICIMESFGKK